MGRPNALVPNPGLRWPRTSSHQASCLPGWEAPHTANHREDRIPWQTTPTSQTALRTRKDRSRAQSRAVSGKEAASGTGGSRTATKPGSQKGTGQRNAGAGQGGAVGSRPGRQGRRREGSERDGSRAAAAATGQPPGGARPAPSVDGPVDVGHRRPGRGRSSSSWWSSRSRAARAAAQRPHRRRVRWRPSIAQEMTNIPASVYNTVGVTSPTVAVTPPKVITGQPPLTFNGKPGYFYMGGGVLPVLRGRTVGHRRRALPLRHVHRPADDAVQLDRRPSEHPDGHVRQGHLHKPVHLDCAEGGPEQQEASTGTGYEPLQTLTKSETALVKKYNEEKYTGNTTSSGASIPFIDIGNKAVSSGASYTPGVLSGLTRAEIAGDLSDPTNPATKAIISVGQLPVGGHLLDRRRPAGVGVHQQGRDGRGKGAQHLGVLTDDG